MITGKKFKKYIMIYLANLSILIVGLYLLIIHESSGPFKIEGMVNIVDLAKEADKERYIDYQVVERPKESKELIAVVFNTDSEYNVGFIDEFGNVIKAPFLKNPDYDFTETFRGEHWFTTYYNGYYWDRFSKSYYDEEFNKVIIAEEDFEQFDEEHSRKSHRGDEGEDNFPKIEVALNEILVEGFTAIDSGVRFNGANYDVPVINSNTIFSIPYCIILDKDFNLFSKVYFLDSDSNLFSNVEKDSIVGSAFVRGLGQAYYNKYGDVIWITYCVLEEKS